MPVIDTKVVDEIDWVLGFDACCTLRRVVGRVPFCSQPAEWACRLACCGYVKVVCEQHRDIPESVRPKVFTCSRCGMARPDILTSWRI